MTASEERLMTATTARRGKETQSATNARLRRPSWAASLAELSVASNPAAASVREACSSRPAPPLQQQPPTAAVGCGDRFRVVLGLGPGRSGTKSLTELFGAQTKCVRAEHEMVVPRGGRDGSGVKGSWGADRRLEWDVPRLARGVPERSDEEAAAWRVTRLLEQRETWRGWVAESRGESSKSKPKKLGARGWREYNRRKSSGDCGDGSAEPNKDAVVKIGEGSGETNWTGLPVVAAVSSVALAFVHEYVALDPSLRIAVVMRPREEVVASFLRKSIGRNHWQKLARDDLCVGADGACGCQRVCPDKTWDNAFPNMTDEECRPFLSQLGSGQYSDGMTGTKPTKTDALRAYWELYNSTAYELAERYPDNVRVFDMGTVLNKGTEQEDMLRWCGFFNPLLDFTIRLNRSPKGTCVEKISSGCV